MTAAFNRGQCPPIEARHRLRIAREYASYDQSALAETIGVSRNTITNVEKGNVGIRKIVLNAWAMACGVPVDWITTGEPPENDDPTSGLGIISNEDAPKPQAATVTSIAPPRRRHLKTAS